MNIVAGRTTVTDRPPKQYPYVHKEVTSPAARLDQFLKLCIPGRLLFLRQEGDTLFFTGFPDFLISSFNSRPDRPYGSGSDSVLAVFSAASTNETAAL